MPVTPVDDETRDIPIGQILEPTLILRLVNRDSIEYLEMRDSIAKRGLWNSISVRPSQTKPGLFEVIDGLYRFTICLELRRPTVPCIIKHGVTDEEVLAAQITANAVRPETKPAEFANQIKRMLTLRPDMSLADVAHTIHKSPRWVGNILNLLNLGRDLQKSVDRGEIPLSSAYMLAKMPPRFQQSYVAQARTLPSRQFRALAAGVIKKFSEAVRQGKLDDFLANQFTPTAHLRNLKEIKGEYDGRRAGALLVTEERCKTPLDGFYTALKWALHLDRESIERLQQAAKTQETSTLKRKAGDMA